MSVRVLLHPIVRPGDLTSFAPSVDITDDLEERLPVIRKRLDKNAWRYGAAVVEDIRLPLYSPRGRYFANHVNSVFINGGRENAKVEIFYDGALFFSGFINNRLCRDDSPKELASLLVTGRLGLIQKAAGLGAFAAGECWEDSVMACLSPSMAVMGAIGDVQIADGLTDFSPFPLCVEFVDFLQDRNLLEALGALLAPVDAAAVETATGVRVVRREGQTPDAPLVITNELLARRSDAGVSPTRLTSYITIRSSVRRRDPTTGEEELAEQETRSRFLPSALVIGESERTIDARWANLNVAQPVASFLQERYRRPQEEVRLTLHGAHNLSLLDSVDLQIQPQVSGGKSYRLDSGWHFDTGLLFPGEREVGIFAKGYIADVRVRFSPREETDVVVRYFV